MRVEGKSRSVKGWLATLALLLLMAIAIDRVILTTTRMDVDVVPLRLFSDGKSMARVELRPLNLLGLRRPFHRPKIRCIIREGSEKVDLAYSDDSTTIEVRARYETGDVVLVLETDEFPLPITVTIPILPTLADSDRDGYPDIVELTSVDDKRNFRRWFVSIAESQFYVLDRDWRTQDRDCAGLIRFACREALKEHSTAWLRRRPYLLDANIPDIKKFRYPNIPVLGERIFRIQGGRFNPADTGAGVFSNFADARLLKEHSFFFSTAIPPAPCRETYSST